MRNTGYKQARIAKKATWPSHLPLNKDGEIIDLIEDSADSEQLKQAILLLKDEENPDSDKYEVLNYFEVGQKIGYYKDGKISGNTDTRIYTPGECIPDTFESNRYTLSYGVSYMGLGFDFNDSVQITSTIDGFYRDYKIYSKPDWIKASIGTTSGIINTLHLVVDRNRTDDNDRSGEIILIKQGTEDKITIKVTQKGRLTEGIPTEYPYVTQETVVDREYLNVVQMGEQLWTQENFHAEKVIAHLISQNQLDTWCANKGITYRFKANDYNAVFKSGYTKDTKNKLNEFIQSNYGDSEIDFYKYQIPTFDDFYEFAAFLVAHSDATSDEEVQLALGSTLAKKILDQTIDGYDDIRISYPLDWRNNIGAGTGITDISLKTGTDKYAFGNVTLGSIHMNQTDVNILPFDCTPLMVREDDGTIGKDSVNCISYSLYSDGYNHNMGWSRIINQNTAYHPKPIRLLRYRNLDFDWYTNGTEYKKIKRSESIPQGFTIIPKGFVRGFLFGNPNLTKKQMESLFNKLYWEIGTPNTKIG